jgi:hypothetical protein
MEINISTLVNAQFNPMDYSASQAELGLDAGKITWANAQQARYNLLDTPEKLEAMREWARATGAWSEAEIAEMDLEALFVQLVAAEVRDKGGLDWPAYYELAERGQVSGSLFEDAGAVYYVLEG